MRIEPASGPVAAEIATEAATAGPEPSSGGVRELLGITALAPGRASVEIRQERPWESSGRPLRTHVIEVVVRSE